MTNQINSLKNSTTLTLKEATILIRLSKRYFLRTQISTLFREIASFVAKTSSVEKDIQRG